MLKYCFLLFQLEEILISFKVEIENVPTKIDVEDIELLFYNPRRYGSNIKIKDIRKIQINENLNRFIIEFESEEGNF